MSPHKTWAVGEEVLAADFNPILADQIVAVFASAAARTSGWPAPPQGALSYLTDVKRYDTFNGSTWEPLLLPTTGTWPAAAYGTGAAFGASPVTARYTRIREGQWVTASFAVTWGTGGVMAGDHLAVSLPFPGRGGVHVAGGTAHYYHQANNTFVEGSVSIEPGSVDRMHFWCPQATGVLGGNPVMMPVKADAPFGWSPNDVVAVTLTYEAA